MSVNNAKPHWPESVNAAQASATARHGFAPQESGAAAPSNPARRCDSTGRSDGAISGRL